MDCRDKKGTTVIVGTLQMLTLYQILYGELKDFDEVLAAGTAAALVPIKSITSDSKNETIDYITASEAPGPICVRLLQTLKGIQAGTVKDSFGWLDQVQAPVDYLSRDLESTTTTSAGKVQSVDSLA